MDRPVIALKLLPIRPLPWASGTYFEPGWSQASQIILELDILNKQDAVGYSNLSEWMYDNVPNGVPVIVNRVRAVEMLGLAFL